LPSFDVNSSVLFPFLSISSVTASKSSSPFLIVSTV